MSGTPSRMLSLLSLLQTRRDWPGRVLAERLGISDRTLRRDVERLRELGYRVSAAKGPDGGYRLDAGAELPPLLFDDDQAVALALALRTAAASGAADAEAALRALATVRQVLPSRLRPRIDAVSFTALPALSPVIAPDVLIALSAAIRAREVLRFDYLRVGEPDGAEPARRRVEPHHLVFGDGRWYLVAWDLEAEDWRVFRADRIAPRIPTGPRFAVRTVPGGDVHRFLRARFKGSSETDRWPCIGAATIGRAAQEIVPFAGEGTLEAISEDRCRLTLGAWSWIALAATFGRFDAPLEDAEPQELREAFALLADRLAAAG